VKMNFPRETFGFSIIKYQFEILMTKNIINSSGI
jgi:hypothetical protein